VAVTEEPHDPFEEECRDLLFLDTKEIADPAVIETLPTRLDNNSFSLTQRIP